MKMNSELKKSRKRGDILDMDQLGYFLFMQQQEEEEKEERMLREFCSSGNEDDDDMHDNDAD